MTWRGRIVSFGSCVLLIVAGAVCVPAVGGGTGQVLGAALIGGGLIVIVGLVFLEVGLSEDRERAREERAAQRGRAVQSPRAKPRRRLAPARLGQSRGHRRRIR